jgi:hypothetical protein
VYVEYLLSLQASRSTNYQKTNSLMQVVILRRHSISKGLVMRSSISKTSGLSRLSVRGIVIIAIASLALTTAAVSARSLLGGSAAKTETAPQKETTPGTPTLTQEPLPTEAEGAAKNEDPAAETPVVRTDPENSSVEVQTSTTLGADAPQEGRGREHGPVQLVRFTLYDTGIYPREVHVDKGLIAIAIEDLSGETAGLVVERDNVNDRGRVGVVQRFEKHRRGRGEIAMTPGRYVIYDSSRPDNRAKVIVEP